MTASHPLNLPTRLTLARVIMAPLFAVGFLQGGVVAKAMALALIVLAMVTDYLDGHLARKHGEVSDRGKLLDPLADALFFLVVFACFWWREWMPGWMLCAVTGRELFMHGVLRPFFKSHNVILQAKISGKIKTCVQGGVCVMITLFATMEGAGIARHSLVKALHMRETAYWLLAVAVALSLGSLGHYMADLRLLAARRNV